MLMKKVNNEKGVSLWEIIFKYNMVQICNK